MSNSNPLTSLKKPSFFSLVSQPPPDLAPLPRPSPAAFTARALQRDVGQPLVAEVAPQPAAEEGQGPVGPGGMGVGLAVKEWSLIHFLQGYGGFLKWGYPKLDDL